MAVVQAELLPTGSWVLQPGGVPCPFHLVLEVFLGLTAFKRGGRYLFYSNHTHRRILQDEEGLLNFNSWKSYLPPGVNTAIHTLLRSCCALPASPWQTSLPRASSVPIPVAAPIDFVSWPQDLMLSLKEKLGSLTGRHCPQPQQKEIHTEGGKNVW